MQGKYLQNTALKVCKSISLRFQNGWETTGNFVETFMTLWLKSRCIPTFYRRSPNAMIENVEKNWTSSNIARAPVIVLMETLGKLEVSV